MVPFFHIKYWLLVVLFVDQLQEYDTKYLDAFPESSPDI